MKLKPLVVSIVLLSLLVSTFAGCQSKFQSGTFTDDAGRQVSISKAPERIVSHVPPITETLFALGLGENLVGVSDYCDYPEEAKLKPSVGNYYNPSIENIVALEPDLVLTDGHSENIKQLDELEITYLVIDPKDIDDIFESIELLGRVTGIEKTARELINNMKKGIESVQKQVEDAPKVRVVYLIDVTDLTNPWTAGPGSFVDHLINMAGGENIAARSIGAWVQISIEEVVNTDPEVIILPGKHGTAFTAPEMLENNPAWRETTAVKEGSIYVIDGDLVDGYGPRIVQGLQELARIIHPERFK